MRRLSYVLTVTAIVMALPTLARASNQEVAEQIAVNLRESGQLEGYKIGVKYQEGTAWLRGQVTSQEQMDAALRVAMRSQGVERVVNNLTVVSPDAGGVERARAFAKRLDADLAVIDKRRTGPNEAEVLHIIGHVAARNILICDDMIDTAGTLVNTVQALRKKKAEKVFACATHGILSGPALDRLRNSPIEEIILTNTVPMDESKLLPNMKVLSVAGLLGTAIQSIHEETSVSNLFV